MDFMKLIERSIMENSKTKIVYFLDRNVISIIKDINAGKEIDDENKQDIIYSLSKIDCEDSIITPMFSLFEGQHGRIECIDEIHNTVDTELDALKIFFNKAEVDRSFQKIYQLFLGAKNDDEYKKNIQEKENFLKEINEYLYQPLSSKDRAEVREKIISIYKDKYVTYFDKFSPIVVAALCCLYGNDTCKRILKPKKDVNKTNYYNAVMDFQHFTIFAALVGQVEGRYSNYYKAKIHCEILSGDKSLNEFFSWYEIHKSSSSLVNGDIKVNLVLSTKGIENIPEELKDVWDIKK